MLVKADPETRIAGARDRVAKDLQKDIIENNDNMTETIVTSIALTFEAQKLVVKS